MTRTAASKVSHVPALRDALDPADPPVELNYQYDEERALRLTDAHGCALGDPVREYVDDVLGRVDAAAGIFDLVCANGRIQPTRAPGAGLDLGELARTFYQIPLFAALFPSLEGRSINVEIAFSVSGLTEERIDLDATSRVVVPWPEEPLPTALDQALDAYPTALTPVIARLGSGAFGSWLADSGITQLSFVGRFTVPVVVDRGGGSDAPTGLSDPRPSALH